MHVGYGENMFIDSARCLSRMRDENQARSFTVFPLILIWEFSTHSEHGIQHSIGFKKQSIYAILSSPLLLFSFIFIIKKENEDLGK